jgi:hypothetical protein
MTLPFLSVGLALLYFGWLWHDRQAKDAPETLPDIPATGALKRIKRYRLHRLKLARQRPIHSKTVVESVAPGVRSESVSSGWLV